MASSPACSPSRTPPPVICLSGPTAVGKSEVSLLLAERLGGEIVSVDSMQVYRGLDLGTAKPSPQERARVPHHLIDILDLTQSFDVAEFLVRARLAVQQIQERGRVAILCGGTGLYFQAFLRGLGGAPPADPVLRAELQRLPLSELVRELAQRDPAAFARMDARNPRRVIRAVEVLRLTGRSLFAQRIDWASAAVADPAAGARLFALLRPTDQLYRRIDARVEQMFAQGLVGETRALLERGLRGNGTALQAIGYRQVVGHLGGERSLEETVALVKQRTRHYAKRQLTWLRHQLKPVWVNWRPGEAPAEVASRLEAAYRGELAK